jgi:hypothetical protein
MLGPRETSDEFMVVNPLPRAPPPPPKKETVQVLHFLDRDFANSTVGRIKNYIARVIKDTNER